MEKHHQEGRHSLGSESQSPLEKEAILEAINGISIKTLDDLFHQYQFNHVEAFNTQYNSIKQGLTIIRGCLERGEFQQAQAQLDQLLSMVNDFKCLLEKEKYVQTLSSLSLLAFKQHWKHQLTYKLEKIKRQIVVSARSASVDQEEHSNPAMLGKATQIEGSNVQQEIERFGCKVVGSSKAVSNFLHDPHTLRLLNDGTFEQLAHHPITSEGVKISQDSSVRIKQTIHGPEIHLMDEAISTPKIMKNKQLDYEQMMALIKSKKQALHDATNMPEIIMEGYGLVLAKVCQLGQKDLEKNIIKTMVKFFRKVCGASFFNIGQYLATATGGLEGTIQSIRSELRELRKKTLSPSQNVQIYCQSMDKSYRELLIRLVNVVKSLFGGQYDEQAFTIMALGSLANGVVTPNSTIEFLVLVDKLEGNQSADFIKFTRVLNLLVLMLGESSLCLGREHYKEFESFELTLPRGFRIDPQKRPGSHYVETLGLVNTPNGVLLHAFSPSRLSDNEQGDLTASLVSMNQLYPAAHFGETVIAKNYHQGYKNLLAGVGQFKQSHKEYRIFLKVRILKDINTLRYQIAQITNRANEDQFDIEALLSPLIRLPKELYSYLCLYGMPYQLTVADTSWWTIIKALKVAIGVAEGFSGVTQTYNKWCQTVDVILKIQIIIQQRFEGVGVLCAWSEIEDVMAKFDFTTNKLHENITHVINVLDVMQSDMKRFIKHLLKHEDVEKQLDGLSSHKPAHQNLETENKIPPGISYDYVYMPDSGQYVMEVLFTGDRTKHPNIVELLNKLKAPAPTLNDSEYALYKSLLKNAPHPSIPRPIFTNIPLKETVRLIHNSQESRSVSTQGSVGMSAAQKLVQLVREKYTSDLKISGIIYSDVDQQIDQDFIPLSLVIEPSKFSHDVRSKPKNIGLENIFTKFNDSDEGSVNSKLQNVLLQGEPGTGKSILGQYISYCWANGKDEHTSRLWANRYDLIIRIPLGALADYTNANDTIGHVVRDQCLPNHALIQNSLTPEEINQVLSTLGKRVLFILDGFDEASGIYNEKMDGSPHPHHRSHRAHLLHQLIEQDNWSYILLSRFGYAPVLNTKFDRVLTTEGFHHGGVDQYISEFFAKLDLPDVGHRLLNMLKQNERFYLFSKTPLGCFLLCQYAKEHPEHIMSETLSVTALYSNLLVLPFRKHKMKELLSDGMTQQDARLEVQNWYFDDFESSTHYKPWLEFIEKLAWDNARTHHNNITGIVVEKLLRELKIPRSEWSHTLSELHAMGLLLGHKSPIIRKNVYSFSHRTVQEYFASRYLYQADNYKSLVTQSWGDPNLQNLWSLYFGLLSDNQRTDTISSSLEVLNDDQSDLLGQYRMSQYIAILDDCDDKSLDVLNKRYQITKLLITWLNMAVNGHSHIGKALSLSLSRFPNLFYENDVQDFFNTALSNPKKLNAENPTKIQYNAAYYLAQIKHKSPLLEKALVKMIVSTDSIEACIQAIVALGEVGSPSEIVLLLLNKMLSTPAMKLDVFNGVRVKANIFDTLGKLLKSPVSQEEAIVAQNYVTHFIDTMLNAYGISPFDQLSIYRQLDAIKPVETRINGMSNQYIAAIISGIGNICYFESKHSGDLPVGLLGKVVKEVLHFSARTIQELNSPATTQVGIDVLMKITERYPNAFEYILEKIVNDNAYMYMRIASIVVLCQFGENNNTVQLQLQDNLKKGLNVINTLPEAQQKKPTILLLKHVMLSANFLFGDIYNPHLLQCWNTLFFENHKDNLDLQVVALDITRKMRLNGSIIAKLVINILKSLQVSSVESGQDALKNIGIQILLSNDSSSEYYDEILSFYNNEKSNDIKTKFLTMLVRLDNQNQQLVLSLKQKFLDEQYSPSQIIPLANASYIDNEIVKKCVEYLQGPNTIEHITESEEGKTTTYFPNVHQNIYGYLAKFDLSEYLPAIIGKIQTTYYERLFKNTSLEALFMYYKRSPEKDALTVFILKAFSVNSYLKVSNGKIFFLDNNVQKNYALEGCIDDETLIEHIKEIKGALLNAGFANKKKSFVKQASNFFKSTKSHNDDEHSNLDHSSIEEDDSEHSADSTLFL